MAKIKEYLQSREKEFDKFVVKQSGAEDQWNTIQEKQITPKEIQDFNSETIQALLKLIRDDLVGEEETKDKKFSQQIVYSLDDIEYIEVRGYNQKRQELINYFEEVENDN